MYSGFTQVVYVLDQQVDLLLKTIKEEKQHTTIVMSFMKNDTVIVVVVSALIILNHNIHSLLLT